MKKQTKFAIKLIICLAFIAWIVFVVDWREVWLHLQKIRLWQIIFYFFVYIAGILISAKKWAWLAKIKAIHFPFSHFFKLYFSATFINNFLPSFIGGDTFKAYQIGKKDKKYPEAFSTVVIDRITGLLGAMILTLFFTAINYPVISQNTTLLLINFLIFLVLVAFFLF